MAPRPFALVRWVEDPEPSCWQVIKTTQITSDRDNIAEGKAVDAIWKKGEETAVAEIIKLGDSKSYLTTVMENDLIKPWKQSQLPPKRVSVPKKSLDFVTCTNGEPTTMECQDSSQDNTVTTQKAQKRKSKDSSASPETLKKQKKLDNNNKSQKSGAANAYDSESESDSDGHEVSRSLATLSKVMAEKALAKTMLKKQRTDQPAVSHKEVPINIAGIDEPKVTIDKGAREKAQNRDHVSSDSETDGKNTSPSTSMKTKGCSNPTLKDYSGVDLHTTSVPPGRLAAIFLLASGGEIPKHKRVWHLDTGCHYREGPVLHPFAFRVKARSIETVISGYRIRDGHWTLIGKGGPLRPDDLAFYPIEKDVTIKSGDSLAARCTYDSMKRERITYKGATMKDEMCNFYLMYWYDPREDGLGKSVEDSCDVLYEDKLDFPMDSDVSLPGSGQKVGMKRNLEDGPCKPYCNNGKASLFLEEDNLWPGNNPGSQRLGRVTAVDTDSHGNVFIFHRASRIWQADSFDEHNIFSSQSDPIPEPTVVKLDPKTGDVMDSWGEHMFFMPHGLTIDNEGNTWLTDQAMHQVFKFPPGEKKASLTLGTQFVPGNDENHFCSPTDVAVDSDGNVFVSDGYCNSRVVKFSPNGKKVLLTITNETLEGRDPDVFQIPHSLSLDEQNRHLFVADRENSRVLVFDSVNGSFVREIKEFGDRVFVARYHSEQGAVLHVANGPSSSEALGFTFSINNSTEIQRWKPRLGFGQPHDIASDQDGAVYVADMGSNTVWKFKRRA